jgi:hypothetical protein
MNETQYMALAALVNRVELGWVVSDCEMAKLA